MANQFWGPLLHFLVPKSKLKDQPTSRLNQMFAYARLAYSVVNEEFDDLLASDDLLGTTKTFLLNVKDMLELYIPIVSVLTICFEFHSVYL